MKNRKMKEIICCIIACLFFAGCQVTAKNEPLPNAKTYELYFRKTPFAMDVIKAPVFPAHSASVLDYGAIGDGITDNTQAINHAIQEVSAQGGGTILIPAGIWKTGPIRLLDNIHLHCQANALVIFNPDHKVYPIIETSFEGLNTRRSTSPIYANGAKNIAITGEGVFDGSGDAWRFIKRDKLTESQWKTLVASGGVVDKEGETWYPSEESRKGHEASDSFNNPEGLTTDAEWEAIHHWLRPVMVSLVKCTNVLLEGVTFRNSPAWCLHPLSCENIILDGLKVFNPWYSQNGDGIDLESCNRALIVNNLFDVGDDAICIKSGKDKDGRQRNEACRNVIIKNNTVLHGHGGFVVGSEMSGGVNNIYVADCTFLGTDVGLRFKSTRGRGGVVENIWIENINMINIPTEPLLFNLYYSGKAATDNINVKQPVSTDNIPPVTEETPSFRNIYINNVKCDGARRAMFFNGLPEMKIRNIVVENMIITSTLGAELVYTEGVSLKNVKIYAKQGPKISTRFSGNVVIDEKPVPDSDSKAFVIND